jgi:glycerophosphoryl diester phosphodiesterase
MTIRSILIAYMLLTAWQCTPSVTRPLKRDLIAQNSFDWQGHRGARGLMPENSIPAMLLALDLGMTTLEMDLAVSADSQLIVSHEPWLNHEICNKPDGSPVGITETEDFLILNMTAATLRTCDCGSRGNPRFPEQKRVFTHKPTLTETVEAVKAYCQKLARPLPYFNIEIKSNPEWDGVRTPSVATFARLVVQAVERLGIKDKACIQSFDPRALEAVHTLNNQLTTALLIENTLDLEKNLARLTFQPSIYSPYFKLVTAELVRTCHQKGIKVIPWTVNDPTDMKLMIQLGVDGIITDYPNRKE